jgi:hypothetical protein
MTFLNPFVLFGLAAAALPLLLHLLNLRKLRTVEFSSLRFLKELQKTSMQRIRVRQILLLIVRTLLIAAIVLAFSRPAVRGSFAGIGGADASSTLVLLLDDSPSMAAHDRGGTVFEHAQRTAAGLLDAVREGDHLYLLPLSSALPAAPLQEARTAAGTRAAINALSPASRTLPLAAGLRQARRILDVSTDANKELAIVTDGQRTEFAPPQGAEQIPPPPERQPRVFLQALPPASAENSAVTEATVLTRIISRNKPLRLRARIANFGDAPLRQTLVSVFLDGQRVAQRSLDVPPRASVTQEFSFTPRRTGVQAGTVTLDDDNLSSDNVRHFALNVPAVVQVLLLGDSPAATTLPALALTLGGDSTLARHVAVERMSLAELPDLEKFDAVILCGARGLTRLQSQNLARFVGAGGGVVIFPGIDTSAAPLNNSLLAELKIPGFSGGAVTYPAGLSFAAVDYEHPLFEGLFERNRKAPISSPAVKTALPLPVGPAGIAVISLPAGTGAFLAEYPFGNGRIFLFAVEAGFTWSDFPAHPLFAPLLHRMVLYLAGAPGTDDIAAGEGLRTALRLRDFSDADIYTLSSPSGVSRRVIPHFQGATGIALFEGGRADSTGPVALTRTRKTGEEILRIVTVNPPPGESDLAPARPEDLARFWAAEGIDSASVRILPPDVAGAPAILQARLGTELWKYCIALALFLAIAEMALGRAPRTRGDGHQGEGS